MADVRIPGSQPSGMHICLLHYGGVAVPSISHLHSFSSSVDKAAFMLPKRTTASPPSTAFSNDHCESCNIHNDDDAVSFDLHDLD